MLIIFLIKSSTGPDKVPPSTAAVFAEFYEQYLPKIFNYISYRVTDKYMAEDLTSVVFEKALTKFKSFDVEKASFSTWLFTIAHNTLIDHYRLRTKEQDLEKEKTAFITAQYTSTEEEAVKTEEFKKLKSCISQLNKNEQEIISLKFGGEMTNRQIARMLGISESNVGITIYRTIRKLRDGFTGWQNE
jgi:RNA polymerase sigma-70 factor (ECF subfamily)